MAFFYEGDEKWESWMREFGVSDPPRSGAMAQWPKFQTRELQLALDAWQESPPDVLEWERYVQPLYDTWLSYHLVDRDLKQRGAGANIQYQLRRFPARAAADDDARRLTDLLEAFIRDLARDMREEEPKLVFHPDLGGSSSHGTKLGPMDEYDFKIVLSGDLERGDPALRRLYSGLSRCLGRWRAEQDPNSELLLLGHVINNARLPSVVFEWRKAQSDNDLPRYIKVDLAPIVPGKPWTGKRKTDPLGRPIATQNYLLIYSSDYRSAEWRECEPTWKPSSCGVEQTILTQLPPAVKKACVLLKILTSHITVPHFKKSVPKDCKFTSYSVKDCLFWALADGRLKAYWDLAPEEQDDVGVVMLIAKEILVSMRKHHEEYFTFSADKPRHYHPFLHRMFTALVTGQIPAPDRDSSSAAIPPGAAYGRLSTPPVARDTASAPVYNQNITTAPTTVSVKVEPGTSGHEFTMLWDEFRRHREDTVTQVELQTKIAQLERQLAKQAEQHQAQMSQIQMQQHSLQLQLNSVLYQNAEDVSVSRKRRRVDFEDLSNQLQYFGGNPSQGFAGLGIQTTTSSSQPVLNVVNNHSTQNVYLPPGSSGLQPAGSWSSGDQANLTSLPAADTGDMTMPPSSSLLSMPPPQPGSIALSQDQAVTGPVARSGPIRPTHRVSLPVDLSMSSLNPQAQLSVPHDTTSQQANPYAHLNLQDGNHNVGSSQDGNKSASAMVRRNPPLVIPAPPPAHAPTEMTVSSEKTLERFSKMKRLGALDGWFDRFSANESNEVLTWKNNILTKYKFVNRTFETVWEKTRPFSIDYIYNLQLLPDSSIIVSNGRALSSSTTTTQVYSAHCDLVSTYTGHYGFLYAASATRLVYRHDDHHDDRLVVYTVDSHRRLGELTPPPGAGVLRADSVCVAASGRVVVSWVGGKLCVYSADCQLLHTCDAVLGFVSCSDEYIVTGLNDTFRVYSWELEKKAEIRRPKGAGGIYRVDCGAHSVVFAKCRSRSRYKLVAYQLE